MDCCTTNKKKPVIKTSKINNTCHSSNVNDKNTPNSKNSYLSYIGGVSSASGVFSSYQLCHSICLGVIALLSLIGITLVGMPLLFLQKLALPLWTIGLALFALSLILYIKLKCISKNLLIFNFGAIITGIPFENLQFLRSYFLVIGFSIIVISVYLIIKTRLENKNELHQKV